MADKAKPSAIMPFMSAINPKLYKKTVQFMSAINSKLFLVNHNLYSTQVHCLVDSKLAAVQLTFCLVSRVLPCLYVCCMQLHSTQVLPLASWK